jgi:hypothetical protein
MVDTKLAITLTASPILSLLKLLYGVVCGDNSSSLDHKFKLALVFMKNLFRVCHERL